MGTGVRRRSGAAFPGHGQMGLEQMEIDKLPYELAKLKASATSLKCRRLLREGLDMKFQFIATRRGI